MTTRDELADVIRDVIDHANMQEDIWSDDVAKAILARWRLVPIEQVRHAHDGPMTEGGHWWVDIPLPSGSTATICKNCGTTIGSGRFPAVCPDQWLAQHRAADELTRHDRDAGIYQVGAHKHHYIDVSTFADADAGRHQWLCECGATGFTRDRA